MGLLDLTPPFHFGQKCVCKCMGGKGASEQYDLHRLSQRLQPGVKVPTTKPGFVDFFGIKRTVEADKKDLPVIMSLGLCVVCTR